MLNPSTEEVRRAIAFVTENCSFPVESREFAEAVRQAIKHRHDVLKQVEAIWNGTAEGIVPGRDEPNMR